MTHEEKIEGGVDMAKAQPWLLIAFGTVWAIALYLLLMIPDRWDEAVAVKVCSGLPVVRLTDGSLWLMARHRDYRVENQNIC